MKKMHVRYIATAPRNPNNRLLLYCKNSGWHTGYCLKGLWYTADMSQIFPCFWALLPKAPASLSHRML
jgi:hypothetical protein